MSRLIVVSNRVAKPDQASAGGLAVALQDALSKNGGLWFGWSGDISPSQELSRQQVGKIDYVTMDFAQNTYDDFYVKFCNSVLWPLFHYKTDLVRYDAAAFETYKAVNRSFADYVSLFVNPGDVIWAHDYHLLMMGQYLREKNITARSGFFLHIPLPGPDIFGTLPQYGQIISALCHYDVLGFQTPHDVDNFIACVEAVHGTVKRRTIGQHVSEIEVMGRTVQVGCFPISIDTKDMMQTAARAANSPLTKRLTDTLHSRKLIIGVDRLDYTKGLRQRLEAFDQLLQTQPQYKNNVSYLQITPPSRTDVEEYRDERMELEALVGSINGAHADIDWQPIRYLNKSFSRDCLAGFYRSAAVGLVTPIRDGMNLVAKEYVASQNPADPGVLVLSQFAGAAQEFKQGALLVNPADIDGMAAQIGRALAMPLAERQQRHRYMLDILERQDIAAWTSSFLDCLQGVPRHLLLLKQNIWVPNRALPMKERIAV